MAPQAAQATITDVFNGDVSCTVQGDGVRFCGSDAPRSTTPSFDGVPIDVNAAFPPVPAVGPDGDFPLVMMFHGYGGGKIDLSSMQHWLDKGYATFSMTDRGFRESCGSAVSQTAAGSACDDGYVRLIDNRYEVRDAQLFSGELVDQGLASPTRIGAIGGSYGGGMSMALAALKDRMVMEDYSLVPWTSPLGTAMSLAAAAPSIPWTDLAYSLTPNGGTLDYVDDAPYQGRIGVEKQSYISGLYYSGLTAPAFYAPAGADPTADLIGWRDRINLGEPYGSEVDGIVDEMTQHHSSYYIDHSEKPAPLLMASGFTDDLFPVDETIRYYNRTAGEYPSAHMGLFFGDFGHPRGQNKTDVTTALTARQDAWLDHYVIGDGPKPPEGVEAWTETCPDSASSGGPYSADDWASLAPGEIRFHHSGEKTIAPDSTTDGAFNPTSSDACDTTSSDDLPGAATYKLDPAPADGYTLMGAVSVIADFTLPGDTSQVAARLVDVAPDDTETLVDRGLWRPESGGPTKQVFQLHPNGWTFVDGHVPKLELIAADGTVVNSGLLLTSYGRPSDDQQAVTVSNLKMRMPVLEKPGALDGLVKAAAKKFVPAGYDLAKEFSDLSRPNAKLVGTKLRMKGNKVIAAVSCPEAFEACTDGTVSLKANDTYKGRGLHFAVGSAGFNKIEGGDTATLTPKLSEKARKFLKNKQPKLSVQTSIGISEVARARNKNAKVLGK
jgi:hypothetical protein